jgi:hypothetical protein
MHAKIANTVSIALKTAELVGCVNNEKKIGLNLKNNK